WSRSGRLEFFWSLLKDKKVSICHNGHNICVSVNAVKAHLAHGDRIGSRDYDINEQTPGKGEGKKGGEKSGSQDDIIITIYPNPTEGSVSVSFENAEHGFKGVYLLSPTGTTLDYFRTDGVSVLNFSVHNLKSGTYFLRFTGEEGDTLRSLVKK
ncbi:MAG: T9SS type A sorting domain-containing protein, partial [Bacteroidia bacterium]